VKIYLVGGAIRDQLLGYPIKERDWVIVGATPQEMLALGYRPVGKDFPVFLHPTTHEEYALARTERKTGPGYKGFDFYAAPEVTLEEDLQRRDLTINAMAQDTDGTIIDPYGGKKDIQARLLRHVSPAFVEDPVRILRVARFAARFADFYVDTNTLALMQEMVHRGEVNALVAERVWQEWERALQETHPVRFFQILSACGALFFLLPEFIDNQAGFQALQRATERSLSTPIRFAVLFYALDHDNIRAITKRYRIPKNYGELALLIWGNYPDYDRVSTADARTRLTLLERLDAFRRPERLNLFLAGCEAIANNETATQLSQILHTTYLAAKSVSVSDLTLQNIRGEEIKKILRERQIAAIEKENIKTGL
jgi:tRNA nucleotidyltransferase (CCA-adding enzyme)